MSPARPSTDQPATRSLELTYSDAIREGLHQAMGASKDVIVIGQLVDYKSGVFGTTTGLVDTYGRDRVQDFPVAEATMTSVALGAALTGLRPVIVHQRVDFMMYGVDSIVNWLALWHFKSNGRSTAPVVIRAIVGKGWGQGPQHSKSLHAWFAHLPGLKVAMPATAYDAKGILLESIFGEDPCLILESRSLFSQTTPVPEAMYRVRYGKAVLRKHGKDVTVVAIGHLVPLAMRAAHQLANDGVDVEVVDLRTIKPFDRACVVESVRKTKRLVVADPGWNVAGFAAEIIATVTEEIGDHLAAKPVRVTFPDSHTPMTQQLESQFYPTQETIYAAVKKVLQDA